MAIMNSYFVLVGWVVPTMCFHFMLSGRRVVPTSIKWEWALFVSTLLTISHLKTNNEIIFYPCRPTKVLHNFSLSSVTPLVNMSAGFLLPHIFSSVNCSSSSNCWMKWYLIWICLVLEWNAGFLARKIALWLSLYKVPFPFILPNSFRKLCNHTIFFADSETATYSASVVERATIFCKVELQKIAVPRRRLHQELAAFSKTE